MLLPSVAQVPEHEEHRCHEGKCSMQVHELNDFLNHTSLRNLSGDDMTAICLELASVASKRMQFGNWAWLAEPAWSS